MTEVEKYLLPALDTQNCIYRGGILFIQKEFEKTGYASWANADVYPNGKVYTNEYVEWLESKVSNK